MISKLLVKAFSRFASFVMVTLISTDVVTPFVTKLIFLFSFSLNNHFNKHAFKLFYIQIEFPKFFPLRYCLKRSKQKLFQTQVHHQYWPKCTPIRSYIQCITSFIYLHSMSTKKEKTSTFICNPETVKSKYFEETQCTWYYILVCVVKSFHSEFQVWVADNISILIAVFDVRYLSMKKKNKKNKNKTWNKGEFPLQQKIVLVMILKKE